MDGARRCGAGLALAAASLLCACGDGEPPRPRNLVLIVVDTLRADHTGLHGYARDTTPFLARFARERAQVFEQARAAAPWTKPSVASLLTGLDPRHHQVVLHTSHLHSTLETLPEVLAENGFETACVQSNMQLASVFGFSRGFDAYYEGEAEIATHERSTGPAVNRAALAWLDGVRDRAKPFFLYVHHYEPHHEYLRSGEAYLPDYAGPLTGRETMDQLVGATAKLGPADAEFLKARYDAEIAYQDELLADLFGGLESRGLLADTAIVFTADHGEEFLEHGDLSHQYKLYDELLRVPLFVALPGDPRAGERIAAPVGLIDLGATIVDLLVPGAGALPGRPLTPLLLGREREPRDLIAHSCVPVLGAPAGTPIAARDMITDGRWKLVRSLQGQGGAGRPSRELYDLAADPLERANQFERERERAAALEARLEDYLEARRALEAERGAEPIELDPATIERLRQLGYL